MVASLRGHMGILKWLHSLNPSMDLDELSTVSRISLDLPFRHSRSYALSLYLEGLLRLLAFTRLCSAVALIIPAPL